VLISAANEYYSLEGAKPTQLDDQFSPTISVSRSFRDVREMCAGLKVLTQPHDIPMHPLTRVDRARCIVRGFYRSEEDDEERKEREREREREGGGEGERRREREGGTQLRIGRIKIPPKGARSDARFPHAKKAKPWRCTCEAPQWAFRRRLIFKCAAGRRKTRGPDARPIGPPDLTPGIQTDR